MVNTKKMYAFFLNEDFIKENLPDLERFIICKRQG